MASSMTVLIQQNGRHTTIWLPNLPFTKVITPQFATEIYAPGWRHPVMRLPIAHKREKRACRLDL